jgi:hypothetical protein
MNLAYFQTDLFPRGYPSEKTRRWGAGGWVKGDIFFLLGISCCWRDAVGKD